MGRRHQRRCARGRHEWRYSGEAHSIPGWRACRHCGWAQERGILTERHEQVNPLMIRDIHGEQPEQDVRVIGEWGVARVDPWTVERMRA